MNCLNKWRLIDSGQCDAAYNMALDEAIAISVRNNLSPPTLRFYGWNQPSVTLGAFQKIDDIDFDYCLKNNLPLVRRTTGGRGILHWNELTYSFSARTEGEFSKGLLETYKRLSEPFENAFKKLGLNITKKITRERGRNIAHNPMCFSSLSYGEISLNGSKIIGSAQKRWQDGFLQQGSIPYSIDYERVSKVFKIRNLSLEYPTNKLYCLEELISNFDKERFKIILRLAFEETFNIILIESKTSHQEELLAQELCLKKYQNPLWTIEGMRNKQSYDNNEIPKTALSVLYMPE